MAHRSTVMDLCVCFACFCNNMLSKAHFDSFVPRLVRWVIRFHFGSCSMCHSVYSIYVFIEAVSIELGGHQIHLVANHLLNDQSTSISSHVSIYTRNSHASNNNSNNNNNKFYEIRCSSIADSIQQQSVHIVKFKGCEDSVFLFSLLLSSIFSSRSLLNESEREWEGAYARARAFFRMRVCV